MMHAIARGMSQCQFENIGVDVAIMAAGGCVTQVASKDLTAQTCLCNASHDDGRVRNVRIQKLEAGFHAMIRKLLFDG